MGFVCLFLSAGLPESGKLLVLFLLSGENQYLQQRNFSL